MNVNDSEQNLLMLRISEKIGQNGYSLQSVDFSKKLYKIHNLETTTKVDFKAISGAVLSIFFREKCTLAKSGLTCLLYRRRSESSTIL